MLYKHEPKDEYFPEGYDSWRYWCDCTSMDHTMELTQMGDQLELSISIRHKKTLWQRIRMAWDLLFKGESRVTEVYLCEHDRKEIASVLNKEVIT